MLCIYNTLTRKKEHFKPLRGKKVSIYVCGPTVYDQPHIGHVRSAYLFDLIRRYLKFRGYQVKFVMNVTDVDDKIIKKAKEEFRGEDLNKAVKKVSGKYLNSYRACMKDLGIRPPDREPQATKYIGKMKKAIAVLIRKGAAYEAGGDVYFDISKVKGYGKLSNQNLGALGAGTLPSPGKKKRNHLDFALWKKAKEGEPCWKSPWSKGRPGWHIECSVMSSAILGKQFDIHGGGIDLVFPHHENEIAQSEGLGNKFARFWMHNGLLTIRGEKMAKSLGNFVTAKELLEKYPADVLKLLFLQAHYSHAVDFSWAKMEEAKRAYERIFILKGRLDDCCGSLRASKLIPWGRGAGGNFKEQFTEAMDDDFNMPKGLAVLFEIINGCYPVLESNEQGKGGKLAYARKIIREITGIFGLAFSMESQGRISVREIELKLSARKSLKEKKKYKEADAIREELEEKGIILEDRKEGTAWRRKI